MKTTKRHKAGPVLLVLLILSACAPHAKPTVPVKVAEVPGEVSGSKAPEAPQGLPSFVMGMWKSIDLYSTEDGSGKTDGTPLDRWTLLEASSSKYPMDHVLCLGVSPNRLLTKSDFLPINTEIW